MNDLLRWFVMKLNCGILGHRWVDNGRSMFCQNCKLIKVKVWKR